MAANCIDMDQLERPLAPFSFAGAPNNAGGVGSELSPSRGELARAATKAIRDLVRQLLQCESAETFGTVRARVFGEYSLLVRTLSKMILTDTPAMVHQRLVQETLSGYEAAVREHGPNLFGPDATDEILFSIATIQRTYRLIGQILAKMNVPQEVAKEDTTYAKDFAGAMSWSALHLDCVAGAIEYRNETTIPLDVLQEVLVGLRYCVTAYANAKAGYDLRYAQPAPPESLFSRKEVDDEDKALAAESTDERETTIPEGS